MRTLTSKHCSCRLGLTLIEVIAGLALMGALLAAMLSAKARYTAQHYHALRVLAAVNALDGFLAERSATIDTIQPGESGSIGPNASMTWRSSFVDNAQADAWHCRVLRLDVTDAKSEQDDAPLARVELLVANVPQDPGVYDTMEEDAESDAGSMSSDRSGVEDDPLGQPNVPTLSPTEQLTP